MQSPNVFIRRRITAQIAFSPNRTGLAAVLNPDALALVVGGAIPSSNSTELPDPFSWPEPTSVVPPTSIFPGIAAFDYNQNILPAGSFIPLEAKVLLALNVDRRQSGVPFSEISLFERICNSAALQRYRTTVATVDINGQLGTLPSAKFVDVNSGASERPNIATTPAAVSGYSYGQISTIIMDESLRDAVALELATAPIWASPVGGNSPGNYFVPWNDWSGVAPSSPETYVLVTATCTMIIGYYINPSLLANEQSAQTDLYIKVPLSISGGTMYGPSTSGSSFVGNSHADPGAIAMLVVPVTNLKLGDGVTTETYSQMPLSSYPTPPVMMYAGPSADRGFFPTYFAGDVTVSRSPITSLDPYPVPTDIFGHDDIGPITT